jgi:excinuclease UvrABC nuclease subunit
VYIVLDASLFVLYVGKASMGSCIGKRLGSYFVNDGGRCRIVHHHEAAWTEEPRFVVTVAVPSKMAFEAAALEEYLIGALDPPCNRVGRLRG